MAYLKDKVLSHINEKGVVQLAKEIIAIPSPNPPGEQEEISRFLANQLKDIGLKVSTPTKVQGKPNVIGTVKDKGPKLLFCGHMDTVPVSEFERKLWNFDPFAGAVRDGKLYGRGAGDMKGGVAAIVSAVKAIQQADVKLERDLMVSFFVDEEAGGMEAGSKWLVESGYMNEVIAAMDAEPTDMTAAYVFKGRTIYEIVVTGKASHTSAPEKGINAVSKMGKIVVALDNAKMTVKPHPLLGPCTRSFTAIEGGKGGGTNPSIPDSCKAAVEVRLLPGQTVESQKAEIEGIIQKVVKEDSQIQASVNVIHRRPATETPMESEIFKTLRASAKEVLGRELELQRPRGGGAGDIHWLLEKGIPSLCYGLGPSTHIHSANEHTEVKDLVNISKIYALTALMMCSKDT